MAQPHWQMGLYNQAGNLLADLSLATDRQLTLQLNQPTVCSFTLPLTSSAANLVEPGSTFIKAYRTDLTNTKTLRFYGPVWVDELQTSGGNGIDQIAVTAFDPMIYLSRRYTTSAFANTQRGTIIKTILDTTNTANDTGIQTNSALIASSATISVDYAEENPTILDVITQHSEALDGVDVGVSPIEYSAGKIAQLNVYNRRGIIRQGAVFAYGANTISNCVSVTRTRNADMVANYVIGTAELGSVTYQDATSRNTYKRLETVVSYTQETSSSVLANRTKYYLDTHTDPSMVAEYSITPGPRAPRVFDDFEVGDTVPVVFDQGVVFQTTQRVYSVSVNIDDTGREAISALQTRSM